MTGEPKRADVGDIVGNRTCKPEGQRSGRSSSQVRRRRQRESPEAENEIWRVTDKCPVQFAINLIHGKWKTGILSELQQGSARLSQLLKKFPAASKKMLTQHLREMERDGLVVRNDLSGKLRHVEYSISYPRGVAMLQMIQLLAAWGMEYRFREDVSGSEG